MPPCSAAGPARTIARTSAARGPQAARPPAGGTLAGALCRAQVMNGFTPISTPCAQNANTAQATTPTTTVMPVAAPVPAG